MFFLIEGHLLFLRTFLDKSKKKYVSLNFEIFANFLKKSSYYEAMDFYISK